MTNHIFYTNIQLALLYTCACHITKQPDVRTEANDSQHSTEWFLQSLGTARKSL